jgi:hypothetical protein
VTVDLRCWDDLDELATEVEEGESMRQDAYHAITTPRDGLIGVPGECTDVRMWLSNDRIDPANYGPVLEVELARDDRVAAAFVRVSPAGEEAYAIAAELENARGEIERIEMEIGGSRADAG